MTAAEEVRMVQTAFRIPAELVDRLDGYLMKLRKKQRGTKVTRSDALRLLLARALDDAERER